MRTDFVGSSKSDRITGFPDNFAHIASNPYFEFIRQDVSRFICVPGPVEFVFHFAPPASPVDYLEFPIPTLKVGALGTHNSLGLGKQFADEPPFLRLP
jgi:dTDP-glucose 4,6-dehydratase